MKTPRTQIARIVADHTLKNGSSKKFAQEVAAYLLSERRTNELDSVIRDVQADWTDAGYVEVIATSARPLTEAIKTEIVQQFKQLYPDAKQIIITEVNDPAVIGSVRLSPANRQLDLSVEAKLNKFKQLTLSGKD